MRNVEKHMITINFDFENRRQDELVCLNNILATMNLDELRLENDKEYLATTTDGEGKLIGNRHGLSSGTLVCNLSESESGYQYRIDSGVIDEGTDEEAFLHNWSDSHPDRTVRAFITSQFNGLVGCLIVHHQRD